ncbi:Reverse transcriptase, partial [Pseudomonas aeruginosa]
MRRAGFAIKLRDFEAYERDLQPEAWREHRQAFFRAFVQHVLVLPQFFDLSVYLPRVIRLATACEDFSALRQILRGLEQLCTQVSQGCELS